MKKSNFKDDLVEIVTRESGSTEGITFVFIEARSRGLEQGFKKIIMNSRKQLACSCLEA